MWLTAFVLTGMARAQDVNVNAQVPWHLAVLDA
jgi:hypothetical protein